MHKPHVLIGHRGFPQAFPENTLGGILAAIAEGADAVEFDIQISKDGVPVIIHDDSLDRTTGMTGKVADYTMALLSKISAHEPARFAATHLPEPIVSLAVLATQLAKWPEIEIFAEIKAEVFQHCSREVFISKIEPVLKPLLHHCRIISFDIEVLRLAQQRGFQIGWVISDYSESEHLLARQLSPEFLICDYQKLPTSLDPPWPGPWQWFVYDLVTAEAANAALARNIRYIETWDIAGLACSLKS